MQIIQCLGISGKEALQTKHYDIDVPVLMSLLSGFFL
jgi:hypothetical protein